MGSRCVWVEVLHSVDVDRQAHIFDVEISSEQISNYVFLLEKVCFDASLLAYLLETCSKCCVFLPSAFA